MLKDFSDSEFNKLSVLISEINQKSHWHIEVARLQYYASIKSTGIDLEGQCFDNIIYFDRVSLWDKPSKAPVSIDLGNAISNIDRIIQELNWLITEDGYRASDSLERRPRIV
jgi:hypothetical protein